MDFNKTRERNINPQERANLFSLLTFFYTKEIFKTGFKTKLEEKDLYKVLNRLNSKILGDKLEKEYNNLKQINQKPSIYKLLWNCYGKIYLCIGLMQLVARSLVVIYNPYFIAKLISYFEPNTKLTRKDAYFYAAAVILINICNYLYLHNYMLLIAEYGLRIRTAFCSLIYRKSLRLSVSSLSDITMGKIVTLMTKDVNTFEAMVTYGNDIWIGFIQAAIVAYLIYHKIGMATFAGVGFFLIVMPFQIFIGKKTSSLRTETAKKTDERLQITQEVLSAIKIIKMYTWEKFFGQKIAEARKKEVNFILKIFYAKTIILLIGALTSKIAFYFLIMTYVWMGNSIDAELVYYILTCFARLRHVLSILIPLGIAEAAELYASVNRIDMVLNAEEVKEETVIVEKIENPKINFKEVTISVHDIDIVSNVTLEIKPGLTILQGNTGSGKSLLLKSIKNSYTPKSGDIICEGSVSYASQEPWIFPSTLRQNIIFGQKFDEVRYNKILDACALRYDIQHFFEGDQTIIGDKGINLSKGQQARINLARAVYKKSDIYLLDDCLASLDANVKFTVFKLCIKEFLKDKVCVFVTHHLNFISEGDNVILLSNGEAKLFVKSDLIKENIPVNFDDNVRLDKFDLLENLEDYNMNEESKLLEIEENDKNIYEEKKETGKVDRASYNKYIIFGGGYLVMVIIFLFFLLTQTSKTYTENLVSTWVDLEQNISDHKSQNKTNTNDYRILQKEHSNILIIFSAVILSTTLLSILTAYFLFRFTRKASNRLHNSMVEHVIEATMIFYDSNFIGNILNRFSKDLYTIDELLPFVLYEFLEIILTIGGIIVLIAKVNTFFLIPTAILCILMYLIRKIYISTGRNLQRLEASTRSPVIGYINSSLEGLETIQAYGAQQLLIEEFDKHQDLYTSTNYTLINTTRAFSFFLDILCSVLNSIVIMRFLIFPSDTSVGNVGLAISQSLGLSGLAPYGIRQWAQLENKMTSVERVVQYTNIKSENSTGVLLPNWPKHGKIEYRNVTLRYKGKDEFVFNNINFLIKPKQKIGVVGRTGAGKTSIISTLIRLYDAEGTILIDDQDIKLLSLEQIRKSIAIIPQDPILFSGTLRENIDPTGMYNDKEIWDAINKVDIKDKIQSLDMVIDDKGSRFSAGEKQLLCLARCIISRNKIIIFDEATSNMDNDMDNLIHSVIEDYFQNCTVIIIAHKLATVLNVDKVMVMDKGEIVEYEDPNVLLYNKESIFYKMANRSGIFDNNKKLCMVK